MKYFCIVLRFDSTGTVFLALRSWEGSSICHSVAYSLEKNKQTEKEWGGLAGLVYGGRKQSNTRGPEK